MVTTMSSIIRHAGIPTNCWRRPSPERPSFPACECPMLENRPAAYLRSRVIDEDWEVPLGKRFTLTTTDKHRSAPTAPTRKARRRTTSSWCRRFSASTTTSARSATAWRRSAMRRSAPAVYDRFVPDFECGYTPDEIAHARSYLGNLNWEHMMADVAAAEDDLKGVGPARRRSASAWAAPPAFLSACRLPGLSAAVAFYGGMIGKFADEKPKCPLQMHFGEKDESIPMGDRRGDQEEAAAGGDLCLSGRGRTAFIATSAAATTRPPPTRPGAGRPHSWRSI